MPWSNEQRAAHFRSRIAAGLCRSCGAPVVRGLRHCERHNADRNEAQRRYWRDSDSRHVAPARSAS